MSDILTDFSLEAIIKANEENAYATTPYSHHWKGTIVSGRPDVCWGVTDVDFSTCNCAFRAYLTPENADAAIESFMAAGRKKNVSLQWMIGHDTAPADLGARLITHGFTADSSSTGMAIDLNAKNEDVPPPPGLDIIEVKDKKAVKVWSRVMCEAFNAKTEEKAMYEWFKRDMELKLPVQPYIGVLDGKPVATSNYYLAAGVVGVYCLGTLPEARNKGIGFALTQKVLREGKKLGYRIGILQASNLGEPVYRRMGFKEYFKTESYIWKPGNKK